MININNNCKFFIDEDDFLRRLEEKDQIDNVSSQFFIIILMKVVRSFGFRYQKFVDIDEERDDRLFVVKEVGEIK